jgi:hypothetical protein
MIFFFLSLTWEKSIWTVGFLMFCQGSQKLTTMASTTAMFVLYKILSWPLQNLHLYLLGLQHWYFWVSCFF